MKISMLSEFVTFEKSTAVVDENANHKNSWEEYFKCRVYASSYSQVEQQKAGQTVTDNMLTFTVRYCSELAAIDSTHYRMRFRGEPYNITAIDPVNYTHKQLKLTCEKERRDS